MRDRRLNRRQFIKITSAAAASAVGIQGILAAGRAPAYAQGTSVRILRWNDFIPEGDVELKRQAVEASSALSAQVIIETINANDLQSRITASIQSGAGPDIVMLLWNWPHLYANALVDVSDVADTIAKAQGGFYDVFNNVAKVNGRWLGVPHSVGGSFANWRRSWHNAIGVTAFPATWDGWREAGRKLKAQGKSVGQSLGHGLDSSTFCYPLLWDFGGAEVDQTGKKVVINSKSTVEAVRFVQAFWKDACDDGGLAWDDTSNNRAFLGNAISSTNNGPSIYLVAKRQQIKDEKGGLLYRDTEHALLPRGPVRQSQLNTPFAHAVMKYSPNQKLAKDVLAWLGRKENYRKWFEAEGGYSMGPAKAWEADPMWPTLDKPMQIMRRLTGLSQMIGYPGPASVKAAEAYTKAIVVDMYAKAVQGATAEDAVKWAEGEMKKIYEG